MNKRRVGVLMFWFCFIKFFSFSVYIYIYIFFFYIFYYFFLPNRSSIVARTRVRACERERKRERGIQLFRSTRFFFFFSFFFGTKMSNFVDSSNVKTRTKWYNDGCAYFDRKILFRRTNKTVIVSIDDSVALNGRQSKRTKKNYNFFYSAISFLNYWLSIKNYGYN